MTRALLPATLCVATALAGCGNPRLLLDETAGAGLADSAELAGTPFFPQEDYQCGPAALATVLSESGIAITPDELVPRVYIPARRGSLQVELLAAARAAGRLAYVIDPALRAVLAELDAGRPVLVLQNLGLGIAPVWHYAVVVGYDAADDTLVLRSGRTRREIVPARRFLRSWDDGGNWAMVVLEPGELPATADTARYLAAAAALESAGRPEAARAAFDTATGHWPASPAAWFALANSAYADGDPGAAADAYRHALRLDPNDAAAWNNLTQLLLAENRCAEAREAIARAVEAAAARPSLARAIDDSRVEVDRRCTPAGSAAR